MSTENTWLLKKCVVVNIPSEDKKLNAYDDDYLMESLTLEELLSFIDDPFWRLIRFISSIFCFLIFFAIFTSACVICTYRYDYCRSIKINNQLNINNLSTFTLGIIDNF